MKRILIIFILILMIFSFASCDQKVLNDYNVNYNDVNIKDNTPLNNDSNPFDNVGIYTDPELAIDGIREDKYEYPYGSGRYLVYSSETETTYVSLFKGEKGIYFIFECEDDCLSTLNIDDINLVTAQSDSVEIYIDTYGAGGQTRDDFQHEFRVTASSRIYSYLTGFVAKVFLDGTLNDHKDIDKGFVVEGYVSYAVMGESVDKYTPTSFAFARVTKTGNKGYKWHGNIDPQIPDNYLVLHTDSKFYSLKDCPLSGSIYGKMVDINNQPIEDVKVEIVGHKKIYTNSEGLYSLKLSEYPNEVNIKFTKQGFLTKELKITKKDIRLAIDGKVNLGNIIFLPESNANYTSNIKGKVLERDGKTPIENVKIQVNDKFTYTDENGNYSLLANCYGYENVITYSHDSHISYSKKIDISDISINGVTDIINVNLDENYGDEISFGNTGVALATTRVVREETSFKLVLKTDAIIDIKQYLGSYFEVFIDTKDSACLNMRDDSDYLFCFQYAKNSIVDITNYGKQLINESGITTSYGKINELYYVEVNIPYEKINVEKDEIVGFYFGIKYRWNWAGMYDKNDNYIPAEAPINYVRLDNDSKFFIGSCNQEPVTISNYSLIGTIGMINENDDTVQYDVSYLRENDYVMLKLELCDNGINMLQQSHSLNIYIDMNCSKDKEVLDESSYRISIYPGSPSSRYCIYDSNISDYSSNYINENETNNTWTYIYGNTIYVKISNSIFGGKIDDTIGFAVGLWNDELKDNAYLNNSGYYPDFEKPNTYFMIDSNGGLV